MEIILFLIFLAIVFKDFKTDTYGFRKELSKIASNIYHLSEEVRFLREQMKEQKVDDN